MCWDCCSVTLLETNQLLLFLVNQLSDGGDGPVSQLFILKMSKAKSNGSMTA